MGQKDPRADAYLAKAPAFAKPLLIELRAFDLSRQAFDVPP